MANPIVTVPTSPSIIRALYASFVLAGATGDFSVGDEIEGNISGAKGLITLIENPGATPTIHFMYIAPFIAFNGTEAITNNSQVGAATGSGATTLKTQDLSFDGCANYKPLPDIQGGVLVRIFVKVGSIQFSIDDEIDNAVNPVYTVSDELALTIYKGSVLKMLGAADLDNCWILL